MNRRNWRGVWFLPTPKSGTCSKIDTGSCDASVSSAIRNVSGLRRSSQEGSTNAEPTRASVIRAECKMACSKVLQCAANSCSEMNMRKALVYLFVRTFSTLFQLLQIHSALFSLDASRCAQHISIRVSRRNQVRLKPESYVLVKQKHFVHRMFA